MKILSQEDPEFARIIFGTILYSLGFLTYGIDVSFTLRRELYCHDSINPPTEDKRNDIHLNLIGSSLVSLTRKSSLNENHSELPIETPYSIEISHPNLVGFTSDDSNTIIAEFRDLLLSFNLLLHRVCITGRRTYFSESNVIPNVPQSVSHVEKEDDDYSVYLEDSIIVRDHVTVTIGTGESIKENSIVQLFKKLQGFKRFDLDCESNLRRANLGRSLLEYEDAMSVSPVLTKFKHLFNSLEYSVNMDGKDRIGKDFDDYVYELVKPWQLQNIDVKDWHEIYNRIKHIERNPVDLEKYQEGSKNIVSYIVPLREVVRELMIRKLT